MQWEDRDVSPIDRFRRAMIQQAEDELRAAYRAILILHATADALLEGTMTPGRARHRSRMTSLTIAVNDHAKAYDWFVRNSMFPWAAKQLGENPDVLREQLRDVMHLPWNGRQLRSAIDHFQRLAKDVGTRSRRRPHSRS